MNQGFIAIPYESPPNTRSNNRTCLYSDRWEKHMKVNENLLKTYNNSRYLVSSQPVLEFTVGLFSKALGDFMLTENATTAAFITASNPYSDILSESENNQQNNKLNAELDTQNYRFIAAEGRDVEAIWPPE